MRAIGEQLELPLAPAPAAAPEPPPAIRKAPGADARPVSRRMVLRTRGQVHDLAALFNRVNRTFFGGKLDVQITWGRAGARPRRARQREIHLGTWDEAQNLIRIHPHLDRSFVPEQVVEVTLYHEMLHAQLGARLVGGQRRVHTRDFRDAERAHPGYDEAVAWEKKHIGRLIKGK